MGERGHKREKGDIHKVVGGAKRNQQGIVQGLRADNHWELLPPLRPKGKDCERFPKPEGEAVGARRLAGRERARGINPTPPGTPTIVGNH